MAGFTIVELLVTLLILALVLALGVPSFREAGANANMRGCAMNLITALNTARAQAVGLRQTVRVSAVGGVWTDGWVLDYDDNTTEKDQQFEACDGLAVAEAGGATVVTFLQSGQVAAPVSFSMCDGRTGNTSRQIQVNKLGRLDKQDVHC